MQEDGLKDLLKSDEVDIFLPVFILGARCPIPFFYKLGICLERCVFLVVSC